MKECKKRMQKIWPGSVIENLPLKIGYQAGWKDALKIVNSKLWLASGQVANEVKAWIKEELKKE